MRGVKVLMRRQFVPNYYYRNLYLKLQSLYQGFKLMDKYYKEMEIMMIQVSIIEDREVTMAKFLNGLNMKILNMVELQNYMELENMVHMAMNVGRKIKGRGRTRFRTNSASSSLAWRPNHKRDEAT